MMEIWRRVEWAPLYEVSTEGNIRRGGRVLKPARNRADGYLQVTISVHGKQTQAFVHKLVADAFLPGEGEVDHLNGDKLTNCVGNLERVTHAENVRRAIARGRKQRRARKCPVTMRTEAFACTFESIKAAAQAVDRSPAAIRHAVLNHSLTAGARWVYAEGF